MYRYFCTKPKNYDLYQPRNLPNFRLTTPRRSRFYSTLTCTLLINPNPEPGLQDHFVPIWWEFHLWQPEGEVLTDFDWNELAKYLNRPQLYTPFQYYLLP